MIAAVILALTLTGGSEAPPAPATPPPIPAGYTWPALGESPGGQWACDAEHERRRQADLLLLQAEMPKGARGAAADLPQLEAALAHAPPQPLGGVAVCGGEIVAFNSAASLGALLNATARAKADPNAPRSTRVSPRPMPYPELALLVGSIENGAGRHEAALSALERGLAGDPENPLLVSERAFALSRLHRFDEAATACARAIVADKGAEALVVARLHRSRGYALGELGRFDEAMAEYRSSQALDPAETASANEITYLQGRKAGGAATPATTFTTDQLRKPQG